jgi:hypothetical protein
LEFSHTIKYNLRVIWSENTAFPYGKKKKKKMRMLDLSSKSIAPSKSRRDA